MSHTDSHARKALRDEYKNTPSSLSLSLFACIDWYISANRQPHSYTLYAHRTQTKWGKHSHRPHRNAGTYRVTVTRNFSRTLSCLFLPNHSIVYPSLSHGHSWTASHMHVLYCGGENDGAHINAGLPNTQVHIRLNDRTPSSIQSRYLALALASLTITEFETTESTAIRRVNRASMKIHINRTRRKIN